MKSEQTKRLEAQSPYEGWEQALATSRCADEAEEMNRLLVLMVEHLDHIVTRLGG